jgi:fucose permease
MTARSAVTITFLLNGMIYGAWAARIPAIRDRLDLSDGQVGIALAFIAIGSLGGMQIAGRAAARWGSRPATQVTFTLFTIAGASVAAAPSLATLCLLCAAYGAATGSLDVAMNAHAVTVEGQGDKPILSSFHAAFSIGGLLGALAGAAGAAAGLDVRIQLLAMSAGAAVIGLTAQRSLLPASADAVGSRAARKERGESTRVWNRRLVLLGALAFCCLLCEGAAADWSAIYIDDSLGSSAAVGALGFAAFSVTMVIGRIFGDRLTLRFGPPRLVRGGALLAAVGLSTALIIGSPVAALIGLACLGAGLSTIVPQVFRAAADTGDSGPAIAAASTVGYMGFLVGPPVIGAIAELTSLPTALVVLPILTLVMAVFASATGTRRINTKPELATA